MVALPAALLTLALLGGAEGVSKTELECEEAVKHLLDCCPNDVPAKQINCYMGRDCDDHRPDLTNDQAVCLRDASCEYLLDSGACDTPKQACVP
jgi:hypothetical protein